MIHFREKKDVSDNQNSGHGNCTVNCILEFMLHCIFTAQTKIYSMLGSAFPVYTECFKYIIYS